MPFSKSIEWTLNMESFKGVDRRIFLFLRMEALEVLLFRKYITSLGTTIRSTVSVS